MVFRTVGAIATALIGVRVKLWRNTIRLIRPIRASRFPLRLTLTSCRRSTRLRCRTTHCRRSVITFNSILERGRKVLA